MEQSLDIICYERKDLSKGLSIYVKASKETNIDKHFNKNIKEFTLYENQNIRFCIRNPIISNVEKSNEFVGFLVTLEGWN
ncbi:hypothetical protein AGMMS49944_01740 [Spirochaetia bacterium]|nr:hypothetical protein AGMMS49944_01740 [Spirochaetia bacterium]